MMQEPNNLNLSQCHVMAIVNVTPDSFYSASRSEALSDVEQRVERAVNEGATIVDIGGYSSRPGAADVDVEEEWRRVSMGLEAVRRVERGVVVSIDTFRSEIVQRAVDSYGRIMVNDISAGEMDDKMLSVVAHHDLMYVAMHMRGVPTTMQSLTDYDDGVVEGVVSYFRRRTAEIEACGIARNRVILDPGFGFAKSTEQNMELLAGLEMLGALGYPLLVGVSRKSMIYKTLDITPDEALPGSLVMAWEAMQRGASILRVHDVAATRQIVDMYYHYKPYAR